MKIDLRQTNNFLLTFYLVLVLVIPRSYALVKISVIIFLLFSFAINIIRDRKLVLNSKIFIFYGAVLIIGCIWCIIGFINGGASQGIIDNFRLWVIWSFAYSLLLLVLTQRNMLKVLHNTFVISGILISLINFLGMYVHYFGVGILPTSFIVELDLMVGFHDGYVQITSHNIGSLFFILPYLIVHLLHKDGLKSGFLKLSFFLTIFLAIFAGRRALWLTVLMTPVITLFLAYLFGHDRKFTKTFKFITLGFTLLVIIAGVIFLQNDEFGIATLDHLKAAFSAEDERSIQKNYLLNSFYEYPIFGSGFGMSAGYERNAVAPWLYELTYHQLLFNFGVVGITLILFIFILYFTLIIKWARRNSEEALIPLSIFVGFFSFLVGTYSNPYLGSFDFLIYIAMLPYLASIGLKDFKLKEH